NQLRQFELLLVWPWSKGIGGLKRPRVDERPWFRGVFGLGGGFDSDSGGSFSLWRHGQMVRRLCHARIGLRSAFERGLWILRRFGPPLHSERAPRPSLRIRRRQLRSAADSGFEVRFL